MWGKLIYRCMLLRVRLFEIERFLGSTAVACLYLVLGSCPVSLGNCLNQDLQD
jgi:hypothetical protein